MTDFVTEPATDEWAEAGKRMHADWLKLLANRACEKAARDAVQTNEMLLLYIDGAGRFAAKLVPLGAYVPESTPEFLRRRGQ